VKRALLLLLAVGCAGATEDRIDDVAPVLSQPVAEWLPEEHPAAAAQARWGLAIPCAGLRVVEMPLEELQPACNTAAQLAARSAETFTFGCVNRGRCEIAIAAGLSHHRREVVLTHELGHILDHASGWRHVDDCPADAPGAHLMCSSGPESRSPWPTAADFDLVVGR
jgi:hypothetical protein